MSRREGIQIRQISCVVEAVEQVNDPDYEKERPFPGGDGHRKEKQNRLSLGRSEVDGIESAPSERNERRIETQERRKGQQNEEEAFDDSVNLGYSQRTTGLRFEFSIKEIHYGTFFDTIRPDPGRREWHPILAAEPEYEAEAVVESV